MARLTTMGELTASIAHEINQPLAAIVTQSEAALRFWTGMNPISTKCGMRCPASRGTACARRT